LADYLERCVGRSRIGNQYLIGKIDDRLNAVENIVRFVFTRNQDSDFLMHTTADRGEGFVRAVLWLVNIKKCSERPYANRKCFPVAGLHQKSCLAICRATGI